MLRISIINSSSGLKVGGVLCLGSWVLGSGSGCFSALWFRLQGLWGLGILLEINGGCRIVLDVLPGVQGASGLWENIIAQRCVCVYLYIYIYIYM